VLGPTIISGLGNSLVKELAVSSTTTSCESKKPGAVGVALRRHVRLLSKPVIEQVLFLFLKKSFKGRKIQIGLFERKGGVPQPLLAVSPFSDPAHQLITHILIYKNIQIW
jgi:hypothetical protein